MLKRHLIKVQNPFVIKTLSKVGTEGAYFNIIKATYKIPAINIMQSTSYPTGTN